jgi:putative ABC transport system substrate-binding protein
LVGLQSDIIVTYGTSATAAVQRETRAIPIVFVNVTDPVASIVARLDRPSGNMAGFAFVEASLGGKWLELLSEIAPGLRRAAMLRRRWNQDWERAKKSRRNSNHAQCRTFGLRG